MPFVHIMPPCPRCGSVMTNRIIPFNGLHEERIIAEYMKKGELVKPVNFVGSSNCSCPDCGAEWLGNIEYRNIPLQEFNELRETLGITKEGISAAENHEVHIKMSNGAKIKRKREHKIMKAIGRAVVNSAKNHFYYTFVDPFKTAADALDTGRIHKSSTDVEKERKEEE